MDIAIITGHKRGVGSWIAEYLIQKGVHIAGFSFSDGYDITESSCQKKILETARHSNIFINNAHAGFAQAQLLNSVFNQWRDEKKTIINIGAASFPAQIWNLVEHSYVSEKAALHAAAQNCQSQEASCWVQMLNLGLMDTESCKHINLPKISKKTFLHCFEFLWNHKFCIKNICLAAAQNDLV